MPLTQRYQNYQVVDVIWLALPVVVALFLLYIIVSVLHWGGVISLASIASSNEVLYAVKLSIFTSLISSILALITSIPLAYTLSRFSFKGKSLVESLLMIPFAMPPVALGALLLVFFTNTSVGILLNSVFGIVFEVPGLVVAQYMVILPMMIRILKSSFDLVDVKYEAVARTLGCSRLAVLTNVIIPIARTGVLSAFILGFSRALGEFGASVTLAGATRFKTETLPIAIYLTLSSGELTVTVALIFILILIAFVTLVALHVIDRESTRVNMY